MERYTTSWFLGKPQLSRRLSCTAAILSASIAGLCSATAAQQVIDFEAVGNYQHPAGTYAAQGITFEVGDFGVVNPAEDGSWSTTGTNGPRFLGFNGSPGYTQTWSFSSPVTNVAVDVAPTNGADSGLQFEMVAMAGATVVDSTTVTLGAVGAWQNVSVSGQGITSVQVTCLGSSFRPFALDNLVFDASPTQSSDPVVTVLFSRGDLVPGAAAEGTGIPEGALFKSFGTPAINSSGKLAFTASYGAPRSRSEFSVLGFDSETETNTVIARRGQPAPGIDGATFRILKDPLLNNAGEIAFQGYVSGGETTRANDQGIWVTSFSDVSGLGLELVAREGAQPPGVEEGAQWKSFRSVALADVYGDEPRGAIAFTAFMAIGEDGAPGPGGVTKANDMGLWIASAEIPEELSTFTTTTFAPQFQPRLVLREGDTIEIEGESRTVRSFGALIARSGSPGHGSGVVEGGSVTARVQFAEGGQAVVQFFADGEYYVVASSGSSVPAYPEGAQFIKFGLPTQNRDLATAFVGSFAGRSAGVTSSNNIALFAETSFDYVLTRVVGEGDAVPGVDGAVFNSFKDPVNNNQNLGLAFISGIRGEGVDSSNNVGIWWHPESPEVFDGTSENLPELLTVAPTETPAGDLFMVAREGQEAADVPGARWKSFLSLALPDGPGAGPVFVASLAVPRSGESNPAGITSANDRGVWAVDSFGMLRLVIREGEVFDFNGSEKTLRSFTFLRSVSGSPAQARSFNSAGGLIYKAIFNEGTQSIVRVQMPRPIEN